VGEASIRVLVVDDYESWRRITASTLLAVPEAEVVAEASDGFQTVQLAQQLRPDLIVLDIGLPQLNGIEVARIIRNQSPSSKILFMSENRSADIAEAALSTGASGYLLKSDAGSELLPAIKAVLAGKNFISSSLENHINAGAGNHRHEVAFYADDASLVDGYARFIESALNAGNAVIVVVTDSHRLSLVRRLEEDDVDVPASIQQQSYVAVDPSEAIGTLTINGTPDPDRCAREIGDLVARAAKGIRGQHSRVMVCGEIAPTMLSRGNAEGAIQLEHLWDEITKGHGVHTLCGYLSTDFTRTDLVFQSICHEHSAIHGRELVN